jgi:hypothetical protein
MTVFYRGPRALITDQTFEVWCPQCCVFAIRELSHVWVVEALPVRLTPVTVGSSGLAGSMAVVVSTGWSDVPILMAVGMLIAAAVVAVGSCLRVHPGRQELWAVYRGQVVSMFDSTDSREFGQVRRALARAIEYVTDR